MKWLIALLVLIGAATAAGFLRRRNAEAVNSAWSQATDKASSFAKSAADKAGETADDVKGAVAH